MIILAHDWLVGMRGGEWVLDRLAKIFGPTQIFTLVKGENPLSAALEKSNIQTSPLQYLPGAKGRLRRFYMPLMPWAVSRLKVPPCTLLLSTSSAVIKSIVPPPGTPHICYCHSPARYFWDQFNAYTTGDTGWFQSIGLRLFRARFKKWDVETCKTVTAFIANSQFTADRIKRFYGRESTVIYPPVRTTFFTPDQKVPRENWLLTACALEPYKRIDFVIRFANQKNIPLRIVGTGSQLKSLKKIAGPSVQFLGHVNDTELLDLFRRARAYIFPQIEDFGITAVEAQAAGCPIIAFAGGGALEIVNKDTGEFFSEYSFSSFEKALNQFSSRTFSPKMCVQSASRFSEARFDNEISAFVRNYEIELATGDS